MPNVTPSLQIIHQEFKNIDLEISQDKGCKSRFINGHKIRQELTSLE